MWLLAGCSFQPQPLIVVDPSFRADRGFVDAAPPSDAESPDGGAASDASDAAGTDADVSLEADAARDAQTSDADPPPDAAAPDAAPLDALTIGDAAPADATADGGQRDAAAPLDAAARDATTDAAPRDASPDAAAPDSGPDAGLPDSGRDAGTPDAGSVDGGCASPPWVVDGTPRAVAAIPVALAQPIDLPPLVADFDGDGLEEVAVASSLSGEIGVIDWPACSATPAITIYPLFAGSTGLALTQANLREVIVTGDNAGQLRLGLYDGPQMITEATRPQPGFTDILGLVGHPLGTELLATGIRVGGSAFVVPRQVPVIRSLGAALAGAPAYLSGVASSTARYAVTTDSALVIVTPDQPTDTTIALAESAISGPAVIDGAHFAGSPSLSAVAFAARLVGQPGLSIVFLDSASPGAGAQVTHLGGTARPIGEPIAYVEGLGGSPSTGFYQLRAAANGGTPHVLAGCAVTARPFPMTGFTCAALGAVATLAGAVPEPSTPISVYVSGNLSPDLAVVTSVPAQLAFFRPTLAPIGPVVALTSGAPVSTPAASPRFLSRYNVSGQVVFVPNANGLEIVAWRRPGISGPDALLWSQARGDARRTGRL